jgi:hypothetical protein
MPSKGSAWQWQHVEVTDETGTRLVTIVGSCNGTFASAMYYRDDGYGNEIIPDGSVNAYPSGVPCEEATILAWAVEQYPNRH